MKGAIMLAAVLLGAAAVAEEKTMTTFNFDSDTPGKPPKGFQFGLTGKGRPGNWVVQTADDAPSGKNVLAQTDGDTTDYRFPIAYTGPELKDLRLAVKCKPLWRWSATTSRSSTTGRRSSTRTTRPSPMQANSACGPRPTRSSSSTI